MSRKKSTTRPKPPKQTKRVLRACEDFSDKVDAALAHTPLTDADFEEELGLGANCLGRWRKKKLIRLDHALLVARYFKMPLEYLADDAQKALDPLKVQVLEMVEGMELERAKARLMRLPDDVRTESVTPTPPADGSVKGPKPRPKRNHKARGVDQG